MNPNDYRQYVIDHHPIEKMLRRLDRIVEKPSVRMCGAPRFADATEYKYEDVMEQLGCVIDAPNPKVALLYSNHPVIPNDLGNAKKVLMVEDERLPFYESALGKADAVITHNEEWTDELIGMGAKDVKYVQLFGACKPFCKLDIEKKYDIGFYGYGTDRRTPIIEKLREELGDIELTWLDMNFDHEQLNEFINQCRIIVSIHAYEQGIVEWRVLESMSAGTCVVAETLPKDHGIPFVTECEVENMAATLKDTLADGKWAELGRDGYEWVWKNMRLEQQVEKVLEAVGV